MTPRRRSLLSFAVLLGLMLAVFSLQALGQGCALCLDSTRATPPSVQAAYRHAIYVLGGAGLALFVAGVVVLRRNSDS